MDVIEPQAHNRQAPSPFRMLLRVLGYLNQLIPLKTLDAVHIEHGAHDPWQGPPVALLAEDRPVGGADALGDRLRVRHFADTGEEQRLVGRSGLCRAPLVRCDEVRLDQFEPGDKALDVAGRSQRYRRSRAIPTACDSGQPRFAAGCSLLLAIAAFRAAKIGCRVEGSHFATGRKDTMEPGFSPSEIDTSRPHPARLYNFYLGGCFL